MPDAKKLGVVLIVAQTASQRYVFEAELRGDGMPLADLRRLWEAERTITELTTLRVRIGVGDKEIAGAAASVVDIERRTP